MDYTNEKTQEVFGALPEKVRQFIVSNESYEKLKEIRDKNKINEEQSGRLADLVGYLLMGMSSPGRLKSDIGMSLRVSNDVATKLSEEITKELFNPIRNDLEKIRLNRAGKKGVSQPTEDTVPQNLPVQTEGQEIPVFSNEKTISNEKFQMAKNSEVSNNPEKISEESSQVGKSQIPTKPNQTSFKQNINKPAYKHPQEVESARGLSQEDIVTNRQKPKPYVPPTRDFGYRDEKIGGVNIERSSQENTEDEHLDRAEVLNDIENPVKTKPSGETAEHSAYKGEDPYRETTK